MIRRPPRSTPLYSSAASDVYKRQVCVIYCGCPFCNNNEFVVVSAEDHPICEVCLSYDCGNSVSWFAPVFFDVNTCFCLYHKFLCHVFAPLQSLYISLRLAMRMANKNATKKYAAITIMLNRISG